MKIPIDKFCIISLLCLFKEYNKFGTSKKFISCKYIIDFLVKCFDICLQTQSLYSL